MPALGMAQETGKLLRWLKREGDQVQQGEPIMEIETDKATVEIEAPATGILSGVTAQAGDDVPVGQPVGQILERGEPPAAPDPKMTAPAPVEASPVARRMAAEHGVDLALVKPNGGRVGKDDVSAYLAGSQPVSPAVQARAAEPMEIGTALRRPASPKARRLAQERGIDLGGLAGSGPGGAVLAGDVPEEAAAQSGEAPGTVWRIMAERTTASWTSAPHFYLMREVNASGLVEMRARITPAVEKRAGVRPTYTDLLVKLAAVALRDHPEVNASWIDKAIRRHPEINIGLAVGVEDGLVVPVIHRADGLSVGEIAMRRQELVERAAAHRLRPEDLAGSTFTISNLGMYNVDGFLAVLNPPQAAILAVGRIAERVAAENGQPVVRPTVLLGLSCDHRVLDGVRAAKFLDDLVNLLEEPWGVFA
jgi:pyruvate dehydrogenase E2 component (dihydrolipoamide acetyltransferase)